MQQSNRLKRIRTIQNIYLWICHRRAVVWTTWEKEDNGFGKSKTKVFPILFCLVHILIELNDLILVGTVILKLGALMRSKDDRSDRSLFGFYLLPVRNMDITVRVLFPFYNWKSISGKALTTILTEYERTVNRRPLVSVVSVALIHRRTSNNLLVMMDFTRQIQKNSLKGDQFDREVQGYNQCS